MHTQARTHAHTHTRTHTEALYNLAHLHSWINQGTKTSGNTPAHGCEKYSKYNTSTLRLF